MNKLFHTLTNLPTRYFVWSIIFFGFLVFSRMLLNSFIGDDIGYMNHPYIQQGELGKLFIGGSADLGGASPISGQFYRPLMLVFFTLIYSISGNNAFLFHVVQLLFHIGNALLLFFLFKHVFPKHISFVLTLLFLIHPIVVETVAYISDLQDVLFIFFGLVGLHSIAFSKCKPVMLGFFTLSLLCSLLSKETGIIFSFLSVFYVFLLRKEVFVKVLSIVVGVISAYALIRFGIAGVGIGGVVHTQMETLTLMDRLLMIPSLLQYYIQTLVFPKDLALAQTWIVTPSTSVFMFQIIVLISILSGIGVYVYRLRKHTPRLFLLFIFFLFWFLIAISLHLQILPLEMTVADRWFYAPLIGVLGMLGCFLTTFAKKKYFGLVFAFFCMSIVLFSIRSIVRIGDWVDEKTLYEHDITVTKSYLLEHSLGYQYLQRLEYTNAYEHLSRSVDMFPTSQSMNSLGVYYYKRQNRQQAISWFQKAIQKGDNFLAYNNLIQLYLKEKSYKDAKPVLTSASKKFPQNAMVWYLLALTEYKLGNATQALPAAEKAYALSPIPQHEYVYRQLQLGQPIQFND